jgi:DNA-binding NarL/FixJ family response regulator
MHVLAPHLNVITCAHVNHMPFWDQLCDHFKWHVHSCAHASQLLQHVAHITHLPDLMILDMHVVPLDHMHELTMLIQHMCTFKFGEQVNMCAWIPKSMNKQSVMHVLESAVQSVFSVQEFTQLDPLIGAYDHMLKGNSFYGGYVKHVVRNSEQIMPSKTLMLCPSMCENQWQIHYQLLSVELPVTMIQCQSLSKLLHMILAGADDVHRVLLDAHTILHTPGISMWELLNCVQTTHASVNVNPQKKLPIFGMVDCDADLTEIRQIMASPMVHGLMPAPDTHTTYEHIRNAVYDQIHNKHHVPVRLQKRLDAKKTKTVRRNKRISLTPREQQIAELVCDKGYTNKVIAIQLQITESTVKLHLGNILKKMNVRNRTQLALLMKPHT